MSKIRHIAYEWRHFVVPDYKMSSTVCGKKSSVYGIPGISPEDDVPWCAWCCRSVAGSIEQLDKQTEITNEHVKALYSDLWIRTYPYLEEYRVRQQKEREARRNARLASGASV